MGRDDWEETVLPARLRELETVLPGRLRALRCAQGLSQRALARRAGLPLSAISRLERGQRRQITPALLQSLARGLDMMPEELLGIPLRPGILDLRPLRRLPLPERTAIAALMHTIMDAFKAAIAQVDAVDAGEAT
jgi:transcriptional regulator with XRE-family HTH domain